MADDEKFLVVPLGKKSKAITQAVSNDTAMEIMELLAEGPMSTSKVAEVLGIPLTTAQYNIEKLMEAGLVKIAKTKYSEKGREVKLYEAMNRAIVILPGKSATGAVMEALKRYIILLPIAIVMSIAVEYLVPLAPYLQSVSGITLDTGEKVATGQGATGPLVYSAASPVPSPALLPVPVNAQPEVTRSIADQVSQSVVPYFHHAGVLFFAGCLLVLLLLIVLEYARYGRTPKPKK